MIWIPIADDESLSQEVIKSLPEKYTLNVMPRLENHMESIWKNRLEIFKKFDEPFLRMQDSSVIHLKQDSFEVMEKFLNENPKWGGVALHTGKIVRGKLEKGHVRLDCVCLRREALEGIKKAQIHPKCDCHTVSNYIRKKWRYGYLEFNGGRVVQRAD